MLYAQEVGVVAVVFELPVGHVRQSLLVLPEQLKQSMWHFTQIDDPINWKLVKQLQLVDVNVNPVDV